MRNQESTTSDSGDCVKQRRAVLVISRELDRLGREDLPWRLIGLYCGGAWCKSLLNVYTKFAVTWTGLHKRGWGDRHQEGERHTESSWLG